MITFFKIFTPTSTYPFDDFWLNRSDNALMIKMLSMLFVKDTTQYTGSWHTSLIINLKRAVSFFIISSTTCINLNHCPFYKYLVFYQEIGFFSFFPSNDLEKRPWNCSKCRSSDEVRSDSLTDIQKTAILSCPLNSKNLDPQRGPNQGCNRSDSYYCNVGKYDIYEHGNT